MCAQKGPPNTRKACFQQSVMENRTKVIWVREIFRRPPSAAVVVPVVRKGSIKGDRESSTLLLS